MKQALSNYLRGQFVDGIRLSVCTVLHESVFITVQDTVWRNIELVSRRPFRVYVHVTVIESLCNMTH